MASHGPADTQRRAALAAEADPSLIGAALATFRGRYGWNRHDLARWLGISLECLDSLSLESASALPMPAEGCEALASRFGADVARLKTILVGRPPR